MFKMYNLKQEQYKSIHDEKSSQLNLYSKVDMIPLSLLYDNYKNDWKRWKHTDLASYKSKNCVLSHTLIQSKFYPDPDILPVNESNLTRGECVHDVQSRG